MVFDNVKKLGDEFLMLGPFTAMHGAGSFKFVFASSMLKIYNLIEEFTRNKCLF